MFWPGLTCDQAFAGIPRRQGVDAVGWIWNLISTVLDGDGVASRHVWHIGHRVGSISVIPDIGFLRLPLGILEGRHAHYYLCIPCDLACLSDSVCHCAHWSFSLVSVNLVIVVYHHHLLGPLHFENVYMYKPGAPGGWVVVGEDGEGIKLVKTTMENEWHCYGIYFSWRIVFLQETVFKGHTTVDWT